MPASEFLTFTAHSEKLKLSQFSSIATHKQPKTLPPVVPEFAHFVVLHSLSCSLLKVNAQSQLMHCTKLSFAGGEVVLPCGSKQMRLTINKGGVVRQPSFEIVNLKSLHNWGDLEHEEASVNFSGTFLVGEVKFSESCACEPMQLDVAAIPSDSVLDTCDRVFGIGWSEDQFVLQACHNGHPFDAFCGINSEVKRACDFLASATDAQVIDFRFQTLKVWLAKVKELQGKERELKAQMLPSVRHILAGKRLEFMRWVIQEFGYHDVQLADDVIAGFSLVGDVPKSHGLPAKFVPAQLAVEDLHIHSKRSHIAIRHMTRSSGDLETDAQLWDKTLTEVDAGCSLVRMHGNPWSLMLRFPEGFLWCSLQSCVL